MARPATRRRTDYSPHLPATEQALERAADLLGQRGVGPVPGGRYPGGDQGGPGLADQAAVEALDLAEPADQVHAGAPGAGFEPGAPVTRFLSRRADQDQLVAQHTTAPGALAPLRVCLPHAAAITRQSPRPPSGRALAERGERLRVLGKVTRLRDRVDHLPPHHAVLVDDERAPRRETALGVEHTVQPGHVTVRPEVRQQPELEVLGVSPGPVREGGVHRDRQQLDVVAVDLGELVTQGAQLAGAHPAEVQRVKDEHHVTTPTEAGQPHGRAVLVLQLEAWRLVAYFHRHAWSLHRITECALHPPSVPLSRGAKATPFGMKNRRTAGQRRAGAGPLRPSSARLRSDETRARPITGCAHARGLRQARRWRGLADIARLDVS